MKVVDFFIVFLALGVTVFSGYAAYMKPVGSGRVLIQGQDQKWSFPIEAEETITVTGILGETVVRIGGGRTWVESSPCQNQTCVAAGNIQRHGSWAACLPNNVLIIIEGIDRDNDVDAIVW